jgi:hypothetical protein
MSSRAFLCWNCRTCYRADIHTETELRRCAQCGQELAWVSHRVRVPPKDDAAAWRALQTDLAKRAGERSRAQAVRSVRRQHEIERQLADIRSRPSNVGRRSLIRELEKELASLRGHK